MGESRQKFDATWTECAPKFGTIRAEMHAKILAILDNEQKKRFETFLKEMETLRGARASDRRRFPRGDAPFPAQTPP